jgi:hypothetical protein
LSVVSYHHSPQEADPSHLLSPGGTQTGRGLCNLQNHAWQTVLNNLIDTNIRKQGQQWSCPLQHSPRQSRFHMIVASLRLYCWCWGQGPGKGEPVVLPSSRRRCPSPLLHPDRLERAHGPRVHVVDPARGRGLGPGAPRAARDVHDRSTSPGPPDPHTGPSQRRATLLNSLSIQEPHDHAARGAAGKA